jgi:hypothetical protein
VPNMPPQPDRRDAQGRSDATRDGRRSSNNRPPPAAQAGGVPVVVVPSDPPSLNGRAARVLLRILLAARDNIDQPQ